MRWFRSWHRRQVIHLVPASAGWLTSRGSMYHGHAGREPDLGDRAAPLYTPWGTGLAPFPRWPLLPPLAMLAVRPLVRPFAR